MSSPVIDGAVELYVACGLAYPASKRYQSGVDLVALAPIDAIPDLSARVARRDAAVHQDACAAGEALSLACHALALSQAGDPRLAAFRLGGRTPGETAVLLARALRDPRMGVSRLTKLLLNATSHPNP